MVSVGRIVGSSCLDQIFHKLAISFKFIMIMEYINLQCLGSHFTHCTTICDTYIGVQQPNRVYIFWPSLPDSSCSTKGEEWHIFTNMQKCTGRLDGQTPT